MRLLTGEGILSGLRLRFIALVTDDEDALVDAAAGTTARIEGVSFPLALTNADPDGAARLPTILVVLGFDKSTFLITGGFAAGGGRRGACF